MVCELGRMCVVHATVGIPTQVVPSERPHRLLIGRPLMSPGVGGERLEKAVGRHLGTGLGIGTDAT